MKYRRIISAALAAVTMLGAVMSPIGESGALPFSIQAEAASVYQNFRYESNSDGGLTITGYVGIFQYGVVRVPEKIGTYKVTEIADGAFKDGKFTTVYIPGTVTKIGNNAFKDCKNLRGVDIAEDSTSSLKSIGEYAFSGCDQMYDCDLSESLSIETIGKYAFENCAAITLMYLPDSLKRIEEGTFKNCSSMTKINIGNYMEYIALSAFKGCSSLTGIFMDMYAESDSAYHAQAYLYKDDVMIYCPEGLDPAYVRECHSIGNRVFAYKTSIESVSFLTDIVIEPETIGVQAFMGCTNLKEVTTPGLIKTIGKGAFYGCTSLEKATILGLDTVIEDNAFDSKNSKNLTIYCYSGSKAEEYAKKNKIKYVLMDADGSCFCVKVHCDYEDISKKCRYFISASFEYEGGRKSDMVHYYEPVVKIPSDIPDGPCKISVSVDRKYFVPHEFNVTIKNGKLTEPMIVDLYLKGDANQDGKVNALDITRIKKHLINYQPLSEYAALCADIDGSKGVDSLDIVRLKKHLIGYSLLW